MGAEIIAWAFTSGWASGINAYAVVLVMGVLGRFVDVAVVPDVLTRPDVMIASGVLFLLEMFADKIPYLDSAWDAIQLPVRPMVGATVAYLIANQTSSLDAAFAAATGGLTALASHFVKSGVRLGINASPEPASNVVVSTAEDLAAAGVVTLATAHPIVAAGVAGVILVVGIIAIVLLLSRIRGLKKRYDDWGTAQIGRLGNRL